MRASAAETIRPEIRDQILGSVMLAPRAQSIAISFARYLFRRSVAAWSSPVKTLWTKTKSISLGIARVGTARR